MVLNNLEHSKGITFRGFFTHATVQAEVQIDFELIIKTCYIQRSFIHAARGLVTYIMVTLQDAL